MNRKSFKESEYHFPALSEIVLCYQNKKEFADSILLLLQAVVIWQHNELSGQSSIPSHVSYFLFIGAMLGENKSVQKFCVIIFAT